VVFQYNLEYTDGSTEVFDVEKALISVGRVPNYENLIDESLGLEVNNRGIVDELTQTSVSNIYAVGDITADISLVNVGELEGRYAVERIFGEPSRPLTYENISTIMFLAPEVSGVGMNELQAQQAGLNYRVASLDYSCIPRAVAMRNTEGFIKIIIGENDYKILGMRVVGQHSSSAIQAIALLISDGRGIEEFFWREISFMLKSCKPLLGKKSYSQTSNVKQLGARQVTVLRDLLSQYLGKL
jgi:dihydrolipoamide dehydrogenase